jgi:hypothetical protein
MGKVMSGLSKHRFDKNWIAVPMLASVPWIVMSSSLSAMGISIGDSRLSDDRLTPVCNYLITTQNSIDLETLELREAQQRLDYAQEILSMARERLAKEQEMLYRIRPLVEEGAVSELQLNYQEQQVLRAQETIVALESELVSAQEVVAALRSSGTGQATRAKIAALMETSGLCQNRFGSS